MNQMNHLETLKAQAMMSEYSEKETASRAHEHLKGKSHANHSANVPNNSHLLVPIRRFTKTDILWLW